MEPIVIGHRANSGRIVYWYKRLGLKWVEVDVYWDEKLGTIIVGHPPNPIKRASPIGAVFAKLDYAFFYRNPFYGRHSLVEWSTRLSFSEGIMVDLKSPIPLEAMAEEVSFLTRKKGFNILVSGNNHRYLYELKKEYPWIKTSISLPIKPIDITGLVEASNADAVSVLHTYVDTATVDALHALGVQVAAWTVNDRESAARLLETGVDYIISDRPDRVIRVLKE